MPSKNSSGAQDHNSKDIRLTPRIKLKTMKLITKATKPALLLIFGLATTTVLAGSTKELENKKDQKMSTHIRFERDGWNPAEWKFVKSPRWNYIGEWVQHDDHIRNRTPEGIGENQLITGTHSCAYMSMVHNTQYDITEGLRFSSRMSFSYDQGPQIVLAGTLGENSDGFLEYRDHYEIVLYSKGINAWHHTYREENPGWARVAYARFPLEAKTTYELSVQIEPVARSHNGPATKGCMVHVAVDGQHAFAFHAPDMPAKIYAGIIGYASVNRFYDFNVRVTPRP